MATQAMSFDVDTFRTAMERSDAGRLTDLFRDDAECILIDKENPPSRPMQLRGKDEIARFTRELMAPGKTHNVEYVLAAGDEGAWADSCEYDDGTRVYCTAVMEVEDGKIARQVCVQAWDE